MMKKKIYEGSLVLVVVIFTTIFCIVVVPPLIESLDVIGAFAGGFVNPFASGYSVDVICCWAILLLWVAWESNRIKYGWVCVVLGLVPGVAVGFGLYLLMRSRQLRKV